MREKEYEKNGRKYKIALPEGVENIDLGIPIGPPNVVDEIGLPEPMATRLHNQLYNRGLYSLAEAQKRPRELQAALQSALQLDAARLMSAFQEAEKETLPFE